MAKKTGLTDHQLRALELPEQGRLELRDEATPGLVFRLTPTGTGSWSVRTRTRDGKQTRPSLGQYPAVGLSEARRQARAVMALVAGGGDPVGMRRANEAERVRKAGRLTVSAAIALWLEAIASRANRPARPRTLEEYRRILAHDLEPKLGKKALEEVSRADLTKLVAAKAKLAPAGAAALYRALSAMLGYAEAAGWVAQHPLPRKGAATLAPSVPHRQRVLTDAELVAVLKAAEAEPPKLGAFVRLLVLTGCRESEAAGITAVELDLDAGRWTIPATRAKNSTAITLPLPPEMVSELRALLPPDGARPGWQLLGKAGGGFSGFSRLKARMDTAAGFSDWRWHDLRRTVRTGLAALGIPAEVAERCLNHLEGNKLVRVYDRHDRAPQVLAAIALWQEHVAGLTAPQPAATGSVIPFRPRAAG